jgi:hypothetical protein
MGATALVTLSSCSAVKPNALRVGDYELSKSDFETELKSASLAWAKNSDAVTQAGPARMEDGKGWNPAFVSNTLNGLLLWRGVQEEFDKQKLTIAADSKNATAADKQAAQQAKDGLIAAYGGAEEFAKVPKAIQEREIALNGQIDALIKAETANLGSPEEFFAKNKDQFPDQVCSSHILVQTLPEAQAAKKRIEAGEKFAAVADALTQDPSGKGKGGALGCANPDSYVAEFAAAIKSLKVGAVSDPVQTQFGFHVITVTERKSATYEEQKDAVTTAMSQVGSQTAQKAVYGRLTAKTVSVDPSLGSLDTSGQYVKIVAPQSKISPPATTVPAVSIQP